MRYFSYFFYFVHFALQLIKIPFLHNGIVRIILLFLFLTVKREPRAIETGFRRKNIFIVFNNEWASCFFFSPFTSLPIAGNLFSKRLLILFWEKKLEYTNKNWNKKLRKNKANNSNKKWNMKFWNSFTKI